jgi:hypothetical protein
MTIRNITLLLLAVLFLVSSVSATYANANFTPIIQYPEKVHVNQSYVIADQNAISWFEWLFLVVLGFALFFTSLYASTRPEMSEIDGLLSAMSCLPMFISAFTATSIDFVTSYGMAATSNVTFPIYVLLENHTIYHFDLTGIVLWVFSMIATVNTIRIVVNHRKFGKMFKEDRPQ